MYEGYLPDRRLARRAEALQQAMVAQQSVRVAALAQDWSEQMGYYRLLGNDRVQESDLIAALTARAVDAVACQRGPVHLLAIQDTTQLNFEAHPGRRRRAEGLGVIGDGQSRGFFVHPTLLVEAQAGHALGFSEVQVWSRDAQMPDKHERQYKDLPLEAKESARWIQSLEHSHHRLGSTVRLTGIADREADLYPLFARLPPQGMDLIVRVCRDRRLLGQSERLYGHLAAQPCWGREVVEIRADVRKRRTARQAEVEYRVAAVELPRPAHWPGEAEQTGGLWAIEVRESDATLPAKEKPLHWRLLTTHRVETLEQARQVVAWYRQRWHIEQVFRLLKLEGLDLESSDLGSGRALRRMAVLALGAALDVLRLLLAERGENEQPLAQVFSEAEQHTLQAVGEQLEGRTAKQQNPHAARTLGWAAWIIARLGGWKGYRSQRPAGPLTYQRGLQRFSLICHGHQLSLHDLYKP
jgi:hypothetical protein